MRRHVTMDITIKRDSFPVENRKYNFFYLHDSGDIDLDLEHKSVTYFIV